MGPRKISSKLYLSFTVVIVGFMLFGLYFFNTLNTLKVNGPIYRQLVEGKDLVADILPPPNYIIETYLAAYELRDCMGDGVNVSRLTARLKELKGEYDKRHEYWKNETILFKDNEAIRKTMVDESYAPAIEFYRVLDGEYIPAIRANDRSLVDSILNGKLKALYDKHRICIDQVVRMTNEQNLVIEQSSAKLERQSLAVCVALCAVSIIAGFALMLLIARSIMRPINLTTEMLRKIGEGDLTGRVEISSRDEISEMAVYFNRTIDKVKVLIAAISAQSESLLRVGTELVSSMKDASCATEEIGSGIRSVNDQTISQSASVAEANAAMEQISRNIEQLNGYIEQQSSSVIQSSAAVNQMIESIATVTDKLDLNAGNVKALAILSDSGKADLDGVLSSISAVAKDTEGLLDISQIIQDIASQTNLLSMNAAIEAAHAGNAGKGFAVVADEIRKLAESSGSQAKTVSNTLKKINDSMTGITGATDLLLRKFADIDSGIQQFSAQEQGIMSAMAEQSAGSKEILSAIDLLNGISVRVRDGSGEMLIGSREVIQESANLGKITANINDSVKSMTAKSGDIERVVTRVNAIGDETRSSIESLIGEIGKFKVHA